MAQDKYGYGMKDEAEDAIDRAFELAKKFKEAAAKSAAEREVQQAQTATLMARKKRAEAAIKAAVGDRLKKADPNDPKLREAFIIHWMMGGFNTDHPIFAIRSHAIDLGSTALYRGGKLIAMRLEKNPGYPVFLLAQLPAAAEVEKVLKIYMRAYAYIKGDHALEDLWQK